MQQVNQYAAGLFLAFVLEDMILNMSKKLVIYESSAFIWFKTHVLRVAAYINAVTKYLVNQLAMLDGRI